MLFSSPNALAGGLVSLLLFPWLNPVASGPSPSVFPWLMATACSVALWSVRANLSARHIAVTWLWAAVISSAIGLLQYFGYTQGLQGWVHHTGLGDAFANLRQRNQFATLTSMGLVALLWCESQSVDSIRPFLNRQRIFRVAAMLILPAPLVMAMLVPAVKAAATGAAPVEPMSSWPLERAEAVSSPSVPPV